MCLPQTTTSYWKRAYHTSLTIFLLCMISMLFRLMVIVPEPVDVNGVNRRAWIITALEVTADTLIFVISISLSTFSAEQACEDLQ